MRKLLKPSLYLSALTTLFAGSAFAQQAPAQTTPPATTQQAPTSTAPKTPAAKPKTSTTAKTATPLTLNTEKEKFSYALGMNLGQGLQKQAVEVDPTILARGFRDAFTNGKTLLTEDEARTVLQTAQA